MTSKELNERIDNIPVYFGDIIDVNSVKQLIRDVLQEVVPKPFNIKERYTGEEEREQWFDVGYNKAIEHTHKQAKELGL